MIEFQKDIPLSKFSTFKIGGPADYFIDCKSIDQLPEIIQKAQSMNLPFIVIGGGSNTIFHENGFRGVVIKISAFQLDIPSHDQEAIVTADAGIILNALIMQTLRHDLIGMENLFGIHGTLGGAIRGNAGAHGTEIQDILHSVTYYDPATSQITTSPKEEFEFSYRTSTFKNWQQNSEPRIILQAKLALTHDPAAAKVASAGLFETQRIRNAKYPPQPNCGSFFKNLSPQEAADLIAQNPEIPRSSGNVPVGYLSEQAGCKGLQFGDAQVSEEHGNFLINLGSATQTDLITLAKKVQEQVQDKFGIQLEPEVQFIGETGPVKI